MSGEERDTIYALREAVPSLLTPLESPPCLAASSSAVEWGSAVGRVRASPCRSPTRPRRKVATPMGPLRYALAGLRARRWPPGPRPPPPPRTPHPSLPPPEARCLVPLAPMSAASLLDTSCAGILKVLWKMPAPMSPIVSLSESPDNVGSGLWKHTCCTDARDRVRIRQLVHEDGHFARKDTEREGLAHAAGAPAGDESVAKR